MTATAIRTSAVRTSAVRTKAPSPRPVPRRPVVARPVPARRAPASTRAASPRTTPAVYRRRRLAALAAVVLLATVVVLLAARVGHAGAELDGPPPAPAVYVVQPGDTLWTIAERVAPDVDRRDVVAQLSDAAGGTDLVPGQRIELPRYFD
jgi:nucleoid-associated protein YgaU